MASVQVPLTFEIYRIDPAGDVFVRNETINAVVQQAVKIGKLTSSHLKLDDEGVSRVHAVIELPNAEEVFITDLGSSKGTIVNGQKVSKVKLQSGDTITLGGMKLIVKIGTAVQGEAAPSPPPATRATMMGMKAVTPDSLTPPTPRGRSAGCPPAPAQKDRADCTDGACAKLRPFRPRLHRLRMSPAPAPVAHAPAPAFAAPPAGCRAGAVCAAPCACAHGRRAARRCAQLCAAGRLRFVGGRDSRRQQGHRSDGHVPGRRPRSAPL